MGSTWSLCSTLAAAINILTDYLQITILSIKLADYLSIIWQLWLFISPWFHIMYKRTIYFNSEQYNAFEFYVPLAMFYRGRNDRTLPTCVTRRRHSSCCTAITVIIMYWCFFSLWYWYRLFVYDSWAVSALISVNKSVIHYAPYSKTRYHIVLISFDEDDVLYMISTMLLKPTLWMHNEFCSSQKFKTSTLRRLQYLGKILKFCGCWCPGSLRRKQLWSRRRGSELPTPMQYRNWYKMIMFPDV